MTIKTDAVIIGAGPVGLFSVFELGILGLNAHVIDNLDKIGGQCIELYPDKPIYDIPGVPNCTGELLIKNLLDQIKPFKPEFHLNQRVNEIKKNDKLWRVITSENKIFETPNIIIAGGVGSFEPRKVDIKNAEKFEGKGFYYSVKDKSKFKDQIIAIFGGGDSALDWTLELSNIAKKIYLIHRREDFKGAPHTLSKIKEIAKTGKANFRFTGNQNVIIADVLEADKPAIEKLLNEFKLDEHTANAGALRKNAIACVAFNTCPLALAEAQRYLPTLIDKIEPILTKHGLQDDEIILRMTGCPNGCGRSPAAEIGFVGTAYGQYNLHIGGDREGERLNTKYKDSLNEEEILTTLDELFEVYSKERNSGETFGDFSQRKWILN